MSALLYPPSTIGKAQSLHYQGSLKSVTVVGVAMKRAMGFPPFSFFFPFSYILLVSFRNLKMGSIVVEHTPQAIESIIDDEELARIREQFDILASIKLKLSAPSKRVTMRSVT